MRPLQQELVSRTTGTGSGTPATATSATRACTKWISPAGAWVSIFPTSVVASGGKYVYDDDQETPNTQLARFDYGDKELVFEVRGLQTGKEADLSQNRIQTASAICSTAAMAGWRSMPTAIASTRAIPKANSSQEAKYEEPVKTDTAPHIANFLSAIRSRKYQDLHADVDIGRISADLCHLANISYRRGGRLLKFDPKTEKFADSEAERHGPPGLPQTLHHPPAHRVKGGGLLARAGLLDPQMCHSASRNGTSTVVITFTGCPFSNVGR